MRRSLLLRAVSAATVATFALGGCGQMDRTATQPKSDDAEVFEAKLAGSNEVPPVMTSGTGEAVVHYDKKAQMIHWKITHSGLSGPVAAGHFHGPAGSSENAPPVVPLTGDLNSSPIEGEAKVSAEQAKQLMDGRWYVNLHTKANPNGELRGQLTQRR